MCIQIDYPGHRLKPVRVAYQVVLTGPTSKFYSIFARHSTKMGEEQIAKPFSNGGKVNQGFHVFPTLKGAIEYYMEVRFHRNNCIREIIDYGLEISAVIVRVKMTEPLGAGYIPKNFIGEGLRCMLYNRRKIIGIVRK